MVAVWGNKKILIKLVWLPFLPQSAVNALLESSSQKYVNFYH